MPLRTPTSTPSTHQNLTRHENAPRPVPPSQPRCSPGRHRVRIWPLRYSRTFHSPARRQLCCPLPSLLTHTEPRQPPRAQPRQRPAASRIAADNSAGRPAPRSPDYAKRCSWSAGSHLASPRRFRCFVARHTSVAHACAPGTARSCMRRSPPVRPLEI